MRDDSQFWTAPQDVGRDAAQTALHEVTLRQTLVSGPGVLNQMTVPVLRWPDLVPEDGAAYALSLRRDRVLIVGGESLDEGWHQASQQAVSDVSGCWRVFDLPGPRAFAILERGGEVSVDVPSSSAVRLLFGFEVLLSLRPEQGCRIHVPTAQAVALIQHVSHLVSVI